MMRKSLLSQTTIVTPNIPEALLMWREYFDCDSPPTESISDLEEFVKKLSDILPGWILVKGGHCPFRRDGRAAKTEEEKELVVDILYRDGTAIKFEAPYQSSRHTHGTGCSLACRAHFPPRVRLYLTSLNIIYLISVDCLQLGPRNGYAESCAAGISLHRGRHPDCARVGQRKWAP